MAQKPGEFYKEAQNAANNINMYVFSARACRMSSESDTLLNREKYSQSVQSLEILDGSKWPKEADPCFGDKQVTELAKQFNVCVSS
jgi:hypothetical protein